MVKKNIYAQKNINAPKMTSDEQKIYRWGRAIAELADNPFFQTYNEMVDTIIESLEKSLCELEPETVEGNDYGMILARRSGKVKGMQQLKEVAAQYKNFYLKNLDKIEED